MRYRFCEMNGRIISEGIYGNGCWKHVRPSGPYFKLLIIIDADTLKNEIDVTLDVAAEARKLKLMSEGVPEGEAKESMMKRIDLWASLTKDQEFKDTLIKMLSDAHSECEEALYALQWTGIGAWNSIDNTSFDKLEWVLELKMPALMSNNSSWSIMRSVQEYMKNKAIAGWSQSVLQDAAPDYASRADVQLSMIRNIVRHRNAGQLERSFGLL